MTERKMGNTHLLEDVQAKCKCDVKIDGKRIKSDGKKGGQKGEKAKKWRKERCQYASIRIVQDRCTCGVKLTEKSARRPRKVTERKMGNMQLLEACKSNM
jgi:hypothetical protein